MAAQHPASGPAQPEPTEQPIPDIPEPDIPSPLHPEAPGPQDQTQVVATGSDQVRSYLAGRGMPAGEIARLIAAAQRDGSVTFQETPEPGQEAPLTGRSGERFTLSFADNTCQLAVQGV